MRVFFNEDSTHFLMTRKNEEIDEKLLKEFIYQYKETTVTDFVMCLNATLSTAPSAVLEMLADKYLVTEEEGIPVDYKDTHARPAYELMQKGIDMYAVWIEACREVGITPWISFRMNDAHGNMLPTSICRAPHVNRHPEEWISGERTPYEYFDKNVNYLLPAVRARMLAYIEEQVLKYDVDGIELDFAREPYCFPIGMEEEGQKVMLAFLKEVRALLDRVGKMRKKRINVCIMGQANPIFAMHTGFDFPAIAEAGCMDFFVASPRWQTVNTDVPIELWKKLFPGNVSFGISQGLLLGASKSYRLMIDVASDLGLAAASVHRGCDFIYLYNHFDSVEHGLEIFEHETDVRKPGNIQYVYKTIGNVENAEHWERRVAITYDDFMPLTACISPRFPATGALHQLRIPVGRIETEREVFVHFVLEETVDPAGLEVFINGKRARFCEERKESVVWAKGNTYTFAAAVKTDTLLGVELQTAALNKVTLAYADALIPPVQ